MIMIVIMIIIIIIIIIVIIIIMIMIIILIIIINIIIIDYILNIYMHFTNKTHIQFWACVKKVIPFLRASCHIRWHWGVQNTNYDIEINAICSVSVRFKPNNINQIPTTIFNFECPILMTCAVLCNSLELRGTWSAPMSMTRAVPWNSMEFHGTWSASISMIGAVPWNSVEFHETRRALISVTRAIPWNSMELEMRQLRWHELVHGIPWDICCHEQKKFEVAWILGVNIVCWVSKFFLQINYVVWHCTELYQNEKKWSFSYPLKLWSILSLYP